MKKTRNSNIEIVRIISMIFIVLSHYTVHNGIENASLPLGLNRYILEISTLGNIGVILFVLISGYFSIEQKEFKFKKIISLYLQVMFYSTSIYLLFVIFGNLDFSIKTLIKMFLPITFKEYWFVTAYISLTFLSPFLNKLLKKLKRQEHLNFIFIQMILFAVVPTITLRDFYGAELIQFIMFYTIGSYLKLYPTNYLNKNKNANIILFIIASIILFLSPLMFDILALKIPTFLNYTLLLFYRNSIIALIFSITLFSIFTNMKEKNNKLINIIAGCTFGVYLIHDNNLTRGFLWVDLFKNAQYAQSNWFLLHLICAVSIVFIAATIIEYIRKNTIEKLTNKLIISKIDDYQLFITKKIKKLYKKLGVKNS